MIYLEPKTLNCTVDGITQHLVERVHRHKMTKRRTAAHHTGQY